MPTSPVGLAEGGASPTVGQSNRPSVRVADRPSELSRKNGLHGRGELAAIYEDDSNGMGWCLEGGIDDDAATHAVFDHHCGRQGECLHDFRDVSPIPLDGAFRARARGCPVPAQIDGDRLLRGERCAIWASQSLCAQPKPWTKTTVGRPLPATT